MLLAAVEKNLEEGALGSDTVKFYVFLGRQTEGVKEAQRR